jgi:hypothetical protein
LVWGNQEVLSRWSRLRRSAGQPSGKLLADMELLMRAIREDIGHSNRKLAGGDILGLYVNDIPVPEMVELPAEKSITKAILDATKNGEIEKKK